MRLKKVYFSDLEIQEIFGHVNSKEYERESRTEALNTEKQ